MTKTKVKIGGVSISAKNTRRRGVKKPAVVSKKSLTVAADVKRRAAYLRRCSWFVNKKTNEHLFKHIIQKPMLAVPTITIIGRHNWGSLFLIADAHNGKDWISKLCVDEDEAVKFIRLTSSNLGLL